LTQPSRRAVVLIAGALSTALVAGAATAMLRGDARGDRVEALPRSPVESVTETPAEESPTPSETPSPTPSPKPKPTTAAPTTTAPSDDPEPTAAAPSSGGGHRDSGGGAMAYGPRSPGSVAFGYRAGQTSWSGTSNGFTVTIAMSPNPRVGTPMTWKVTASGPGAKCCDVHMWYGNGMDGGGVTCGEGRSPFEGTNIYNRSGRLQFMVSVSNCTEAQGNFYGYFDVGPGTSTAQGPSLPKVKFDSTFRTKEQQKDPNVVTLWGEAEDVDGYITKLVVTFGDGSSKTFPGWSEPCREGMDGWPDASYGMLPYQPPHAHRYAKPGTYTLTLTAYSSACDGSEVQTGTASFTWDVPPPETPSATPTEVA
jgi:hypothetical protein